MGDGGGFVGDDGDDEDANEDGSTLTKTQLGSSVSIGKHEVGLTGAESCDDIIDVPVVELLGFAFCYHVGDGVPERRALAPDRFGGAVDVVHGLVAEYTQ